MSLRFRLKGSEGRGWRGCCVYTYTPHFQRPKQKEVKLHDVVTDFFSELKKRRPSFFVGKKVLEFGSLDINGSIRSLFSNCEYTGLDWRPGPGVDVVSLMHKFESHPTYDVVVTTSALEHDPYWKESLKRCCEILKEGGALIITCGGPSYEEHCIETSPPVESMPGKQYYAGVSSRAIKNHIEDICQFVYREDASDDRDVRIFFEGKRC